MKKLSQVLLVTLMVLSFPNQAAETPSVSSNNLLCDLLGVGCPIASPDTGGTGKEPPKRG